MYTVAHIIALLVAFILWQAIGSLEGLIVACIFFGVIELIILGNK